MTLNQKELAAVLAGLRMLQSVSLKNDGLLPVEFADIMTDGGSFEGLDDIEIDELCQRLNGGASNGFTDAARTLLVTQIARLPKTGIEDAEETLDRIIAAARGIVEEDAVPA